MSHIDRDRGHAEFVNVWRTARGWQWSVWNRNGGTQGQASNECEAWRRARQAASYQRAVSRF